MRFTVRGKTNRVDGLGIVLKDSLKLKERVIDIYSLEDVTDKFLDEVSVSSEKKDTSSSNKMTLF